MMFAGDEEYDDDVTSGIFDDSGWDDDGRHDDDPSPYLGTYSEG
jgi:hypothetical protein